MAQDPDTISPMQPSSMVEFRGIPYTLPVVIEKLKRHGALPQQPTQFDPPAVGRGHYASLRQAMAEHPKAYATTSDNWENGPCVCCHSLKSIWGPGDWWPWDYTMGACLCIACSYRLADAGVEALPWEMGVGGVATVKDGVRIAPEPNGEPHGYEEIARRVGRAVSPQEVVWANLGALTVWGKPLGDVIEDLWEAGKSLTAEEFGRLVRRGKDA